MSSSERYERRLPTLLEELSAPRTPDYFNDILGQVGRTRQRPGWTFFERWLPMSAVSERLATAPRFPLRVVVTAALLLLALAVGLVLLVGSRRPAVPAPFGPAANGVIAFVDESGAIRTGDPITGRTTVVVPGPGHRQAVFAPDGTRLVYLQANDRGGYDIAVSGADGSSPDVISTDTYTGVGHLGWSADGRTVVAAVGPKLLAFDLAKGGPPEVLKNDIPMVGSFVSLDGFNAGLSDVFRPPAGDEFMYTGTGPDGGGIYRQALSGGAPSAVLTTTHNTTIQFQDLWGAQWSPDGKQIAVSLLRPDDQNDWRVFVMNADGSGPRQLTSLDLPGTIVSEQHPAWSPDGKQIAIMRWFDHRTTDAGVEPRPITIVDVATGAEREVGDVETNDHTAGDETTHGSLGWGWSPDGSSILETPGIGSPDDGRLLVVNATTGKVTRTEFTSSSAPSWQRTQP